MNKQQSEEQDTFFALFDEWETLLPPAEEYCLDDEIDNIIYEKVKNALINHAWNKTKASNSLGIKRTTLIAKCKKFNLINE